MAWPRDGLANKKPTNGDQNPIIGSGRGLISVVTSDKNPNLFPFQLNYPKTELFSTLLKQFANNGMPP